MENEWYFKQLKKDLLDNAEEQRLKDLESTTSGSITVYSYSPSPAYKNLDKEIEEFERGEK